MPYIEPEERRRIDPHIDRFVAEVRGAQGQTGVSPGLVNYLITRLILELMEPRRYRDIALVTGVLENVKQEFYRQFAAPYEDRKMAENGPVYPRE